MRIEHLANTNQVMQVHHTPHLYVSHGHVQYVYEATVGHLAVNCNASKKCEQEK
jgi:hypothetical protein